MSAGEIAATMAVLELPPKFSRSNQVRTESRYGIKSPFFFLLLATDDAEVWTRNRTFEKKQEEKAINNATYRLGQGRNDFAKGGETLINVGSFFQTSTFGASWFGSFRARQVNKRDFAHL